jgi:HEAT repeat protein
MNRRRRILLTLLATIILGGMLWFAVHPHEPPEPIYQGKPLTYWLRGYSATDALSKPTTSEADEAMRNLGSNAVPTLLRLLRAHDSQFKLWAVALAQKQSFIKVDFIPASSRRMSAAMGFRALLISPNKTNNIRSAIPGLIKICEQGPDDASRAIAAELLARIGPEAADAVPTLLRCLNVESAAVRQQAQVALGAIHSQPDLVVPALINNLTNVTGRREAVLSLGLFQTKATPAVPALLNLFLNDPDKTDPDKMVQAAAGQALGMIRGQPDVVIPELIRRLNDPDLFSRQDSVRALGYYGEAAEPAIPMLLKILHDKNEDVVVRALTADALGRIHTDSALVVPALLEYLKDPQAIHSSAAQALGRFGPDARAAVPDLLKLLKDQSPQMRGTREAAANALKSIDPEAAAKEGIK